ncbi:hypothetical protein QWI17_05025 [Gilvimarinus sp. SDUM040013]|uniref:Hemerythrin-like domain-containing protein n=1 Tax=Gilvimarinus gilvus TaxID=3058038 RepID=A0ABU4RWC6_9GAMM|nr:hypothetical protein [Gilvimarinus sp. SDUM040013]MDO3385198.1 hypothetical protein [Gilvimarinus sp. SDUM040013]MDX6849181.1 hypothetical protein [Gilvimarinus sp. SDUM040013]
MSLSANPLLIRDAMTAIHKTLRTEVFALSSLLAKSTDDAVTVLEAIQDMRRQIMSQAEQEAQLLEAALRDYDPVLANQREDNHLKFAAKLDHLCARARLLVSIYGIKRRHMQEEMYLDWNLFVSEYLLHLDLKEREMLPALVMSLAPMNNLASSMYIGNSALLAANTATSKPLCASKSD